MRPRLGLGVTAVYLDTAAWRRPSPYHRAAVDRPSCSRCRCAWRSMFWKAKTSPGKITTASDHVAPVQRSLPPFEGGRAGARSACVCRSIFWKAKTSPGKITTASDHVAPVAAELAAVLGGLSREMLRVQTNASRRPPRDFLSASPRPTGAECGRRTRTRCASRASSARRR